MEEEIKNKELNNRRSSIWKTMLYLVIFILLIPIILSVLLQIKPVQNFAVDQTTSYLGRKFNGEIVVGEVDFSMRYGLDLEGFTLIDDRRDTLISAQHLVVNLGSSVLSILSNQLDINNINLVKPKIRITKLRGEQKTNIDLVLNKLFGASESNSRGESVFLDIKDLKLEDLDFELYEEATGDRQVIRLDYGHVKIDKLLPNELIHLELLKLNKPYIHLVKGSGASEFAIEKGSIDENISKESSFTQIKIDDVEINSGMFALDDENRPLLKDMKSLDYSHFALKDIEVDISEYHLSEPMRMVANVDHMSFVDNQGFKIKDLRSQNVLISNTEIDVPNLRLETNQSLIRDRLQLRYGSFDSFKKFEEAVNINAYLSKSKVSITELTHFIRSLNDAPIFQKNMDKIVRLNGDFKGTVNDLSGKDIALSVGDLLSLSGNFTSSDLARKGAEYFDINIDSFTTSIQALSEIIPKFKAPANFYKLGNITFQGNYQGVFSDFVANGTFSTALGDAVVNMALNTTYGVDEAKYSGDLQLKSFDLGAWLDDEKIGRIDFKGSVKNGLGLNAETAKVDLAAEVSSLVYNNYQYENFTLDGNIDKNAFNGSFSIQQEDIALNFDGTIEMDDGIPYFAFDADIDRLDLYKLNLSKKPLQIVGNFVVDMEGKDIDDLVGESYGKNIKIFTNNKTYAIDTLATNIIYNDPTHKQLFVNTELFDVKVDGDYRLKTIVPTIRQMIKDDYPKFLSHWPENVIDTSHQDISIDLQIRDTKNILDLAGLKDTRLRDVVIQGEINTLKDIIALDGEFDVFNLGSNELFDASISLINQYDEGTLRINVDSSYIGKMQLNPITAVASLQGDSLTFNVRTDELLDSLQRLDLILHVIPRNEGYGMSFDNDQLLFLGKNWKFNEDNSLYLSDGYVEAKDLILSDGNRSIEVRHSDDHKGLSVFLDDFDMNLINPILRAKNLTFSGVGDAHVWVSDIFNKSPNLSANIEVPSFQVNKDNFGKLKLNLIKSTNAPMDIDFKVSKDDYYIQALAEIDLDRKYLATKVTSKKFPLRIFEYIIKDGIKDTYGGIDLEANIMGPFDDIKIDGLGKVIEAGTTVIYTNAAYHMNDQKFTVTEDRIDVTGARIYDENENFGVLTGGLNHDLFDDFILDVNVRGEDVVALNTTREDNPLYYGYGKGFLDVDFTGPFHLVNMKFEVETKEGSVLNIPIQTSEGNVNESFITFVKTEDVLNPKGSLTSDFKLEGIDIEMNLTLTPQAQVNLIFDEYRGDIIQGRGQGDLKIYITRAGDFNVYGDYDITSGEYLFTALRAVAKPFNVRSGSQIRWTGDPINATLDVKADYEVRAPLNIFLNEYLSTPQLANDAGNKTPVELLLNLKNKLFSPTVSFDLNFPELTGELRSLADSKMRTLRSNQNDLNNQVLGLIVFNSFLPSSSLRDIGGASLSTAGISTLSEFVSSQLSLVLTGLINEALTENGLVSGIDFELGLKKNTFFGVSNTSNDLLPDEIEVHLKNKFRFLDERLSLNVGGNYVRAPIRNVQEYFIGDFVLEYFLTNDRRLKLRMYGKYDYDEALADRKLRYGLGLGFRTEFGSISEFQSSFEDDLREIINGEAK